MDIKKFIKDNAIYSFENNIYDFIMKKDTNHWDDLYKDGIKGNPQNDFDNLKNFIDEAIKDRESCKTYLPILDLLSQKKNVQSLIEIGSGSGTFSLIAKKLGLINEVCLVEKSMTALLISQKLFSAFNEDALFVYADALDLPFKNYSFDVSISGGLIEHFVETDQEKIISEQNRVARYALYQFPNSTPAYWAQRLLITCLNGGWPFGYEKPLKKDFFLSFFDKNIKYDESYHDFITAFCFRYASKISILKKITKKKKINHLFRTDLIIGVYYSDKMMKDIK